MIAAVRTYIEGRIREANSSYRPINDPIGDDDLANSNLDKSYKILFTDAITPYTGNSYTIEIPVAVELYKKSNKDVVNAFDELYGTAISVQNEIINPRQVKNQETFTDIISNTIVPESLQTNDKVFKVTLNLTVRIDFTFTE